MKIRSFLALVLAVAIAAAVGLAWSPSPAQAEDTVDVGVTQAMEEIINAYDTAADERRLPENHGEVVSRWTNLVDEDTGYSAPSELVTNTVDTGWDMSDITAADSQFVDSVSDTFLGDTEIITAGDSVVRAVRVANMGNNYAAIDFSALHEPLTDNDTFNLSLYYEDGFLTAEEFDPTFAEVGTGGTGGVSGDIVGWTMGQVRTIFLVVESHADAADGDEVKSDFLITNNAPVFGENLSTSGDGWERGTPTDEDQYDTQTGVFWTQLAGPVIEIDKDQEIPSGQTRPGDTINYTLTLDNTGGDTASDVVIVDAIPQFTSYVVGSASGDPTEYGVGPTIEYSDDLETWDTTQTGEEDGIRWTYETIPAGQEEGDYGSLELDFSVTID